MRRAVMDWPGWPLGAPPQWALVPPMCRRPRLPGESGRPGTCTGHRGSALDGGEEPPEVREAGRTPVTALGRQDWGGWTEGRRGSGDEGRVLLDSKSRWLFCGSRPQAVAGEWQLERPFGGWKAFLSGWGWGSYLEAAREPGMGSEVKRRPAVGAAWHGPQGTPGGEGLWGEGAGGQIHSPGSFPPWGQSGRCPWGSQCSPRPLAEEQSQDGDIP